jgi:hypothetical protein
MVAVLLSLLTGFLTGFYIGRRRGIKEGEEIASSYCPLELRKQSLEGGICVICNSAVDCLKSTSMIE